MSRRVFAVAAVVSAILLAVTVILWIVALSVSPGERNYDIALGKEFYVGFCRGRIALYNDGEYGPYQGSILGLGPPQWERELWFGNRWGIYYRYFRWPDQTVLWTLTVSFLYPL